MMNNNYSRKIYVGEEGCPVIRSLYCRVSPLCPKCGDNACEGMVESIGTNQHPMMVIIYGDILVNMI